VRTLRTLAISLAECETPVSSLAASPSRTRRAARATARASCAASRSRLAGVARRTARALRHPPINNVVDATNFVLLDVGHPLHASTFSSCGARDPRAPARPGEAITTLDGVERALTTSDLVIADASRAVAVAGVMGAANSEIATTTRDVLIESAYFDPRSCGRRRADSPQTEASHRFERGADRPWRAPPWTSPRS